MVKAMKWKLTKYEWENDTNHLVIARQWYIEADRIEVEGHVILRAYRTEGLVYVCRDWDEVELVTE